MTLIVVGDVEPEKVFALATQHFEAVPDRPSPIPHPPFKIVPKPFSVRLNGPMPNDQGQYMVSVLLGDGHHPDRFAWWVIEEMLDNATTREIRFKLGLTYSVNIFTSLYVDTGYFGAYVRAKVKDLPTIRHCIETYLDQLVTGDFSENDLREAQNAIRGRTLLDLQDNLEMAIWLGFDALHTLGQEGRVEDYFAKIDAVTVDDIHRVAKEYFARDKRFMLEHQPMLTPRQIRPAALGLLGATTALWSLQKYRRRNR
jgi:zinc protease